MKKIIALILIILMAMPFVLAQPSDDGQKVLGDKEGHVMMGFPANQSLCQDIFAHKSDVVGFEFPSVFPYKNEVFHIYYASEKPFEKPFGTLVIDESVIKDFSCDIIGNATFNVFISGDDVLESIGNNENSLDAYNEAIKSGNIRIEGVGFTRKVKGFLTNVLARVASWFI